MVFNSGDFEIFECGERLIVVRGVAQLFYQDGFPISVAIDELAQRGFVVSLLHIADQCWNNGWSPTTIIRKLKGETALDINKSMADIDWVQLEKFCHLLEHPQRSNGGYEESREMIFNYLFGCTPNDVRNGLNDKPAKWLKELTIVENDG